MNWAGFSIKHKYTVIAFVLAVIIFGIYAKENLQVELFPETNPPLVNVVTGYPGVASEDVADNLTKPLEEEFITIPGVKKISSTSQDGMSLIKVEFNYGENVDDKAVEIQNAIVKTKRILPPECQEPQVMKFSTANKPVLTIGITSSEIELDSVRNLAENDIKEKLQLVEGVAAVDVFGAHQQQINILVDRDKLNGLNITLDKLIAAIKLQNLTAPGGRINEGAKETSIRFTSEYTSLEELEQTIIENRNGKLIYLRDVATVVLAEQEQRSAYRHQGQEKIAIQILKRDEANTVEVINQVKKELTQLKALYPQLKIEIAADDSVFTVQVVDNMIVSVRDAIFFTAIIILIFLVAFNESLVVCISIPLSLLSTFALMKMSGMAFNLITLSAVILVIGMVVDDSIIVVENIMRHQKELGKDLYTAAIEGTQEIMMPAIMGTLTIISVMVPLLFIKGFVGRVFGPLALTVIYAILSSAVMAFTIIPLVTVILGNKRWLKGEQILLKITKPLTKLLDLLKDFYGIALKWALKARILTLAIVFSLMLAGVGLLSLIGMDVLPKIDAGTFFIAITTEPGASEAQTGKIVSEVEELLIKEKAVQSYSTQVGYELGARYLGDSGAMGVGQANITVTLSNRQERKETIWDIQGDLRKKISLIPGIETFVIKESGGTAKATTAAPIVIQISGTDEKVLSNLADEVMENIKGVPGAVNIYKSWSANTPQLSLEVNRQRAAELGLNPGLIAAETFKNFEGVPLANISLGAGEATKAVIRYQPNQRASIDDILNTTITSPLGFKVPLREVVVISETKGPNIVTRENLTRTIDVLGFTHQRPLNHVTNDIEQTIKSIKKPEGYKITILGERSDLTESSNDFILALAAAIVSIYLLLLAQFRSFIHPVTIMLSIPLVLIGVAAALFLAGKTVSLSALLGLILLIGTVVRNGIVLVEYILEAQARGMTRRAAILNSVEVRFRPIMMTALSTIVGMIPLSLEWALGSERFSPLAITVIGGIITATMLTLIVVPVVYDLLEEAVSYYKG